MTTDIKTIINIRYYVAFTNYVPWHIIRFQNRQSIIRRVHACTDTGGEHLEHLL